MNEHYRQGDVLIERVDVVPQAAVKQQVKRGRIVLAVGEATGHDHSIAADRADWWLLPGGDQFVRVRQKTSLVHQEHGPIVLNLGIYRVRRQREYSPQAIRNVAD